MSLATKFVSFDRLKRYTQHVKSYVGQQILNAKGEWAKQLNLKVDKVEGKGLSTNDFTTELKNKLNGIEVGAQVNTVTGIKGNAESAYRKGDVNLTPANIGAVASSNGDASNTKVTFTQSTSRVNLTSGDTLKTAFGKLSKWFVDLKAVAFSGSYNDLSNKPTALKNPKSLTIQQNGGNQTKYDGSTALTVNITKAGIGLGNVENKSSATFTSNSGLLQQGTRVYLGPTPIFACEYVDTDNADGSIYLRPQNGSEYFAFDQNIQVSLRSLAQTGLPIIILIGSGRFQVDYTTRQNFGYAQNPGEVNVDISGIRYTNVQYDASDLSYTVSLSIALTVSVGSYTSTQLVVLNNVKIKSFT